MTLALLYSNGKRLATLIAPLIMAKEENKMLILTRKKGEMIRINENIKIIISDVDGKNIKIGIEAPRDVKVYREEVYERILEENTKAAEVNTDSLKKLKGLFK